MIAQILAVIAALPEILKFVNEALKFLKQTFGDDWHKYVADMGAAFKDLNEAKTKEDKQKSAQELAKLAARWGKID